MPLQELVSADGGSSNTGGRGASSNPSNARSAGAGVANTGSGGGGSACGVASGNGGSGVAVITQLNNNRGVWPLKQQFDAQKAGKWPDGTVVQSVTLNYLVVAGGAAAKISGGGGAGGYRASGFGPSPLQGTAITADSGIMLYNRSWRWRSRT